MQHADEIRRDVEQKLELLKQFYNHRLPRLIAGAAERLKDANFSAEGFIVGGTPRTKWKRRKKETARSRGKRTLCDTGVLQNSAKAVVQGTSVSVGVDTALVPYARMLGEGGRTLQYVKPHHRKAARGKRVQVRGFSRRLTYPARPFIGFSPDIFKSADKDAQQAFNQIFK